MLFQPPLPFLGSCQCLPGAPRKAGFALLLLLPDVLLPEEDLFLEPFQFRQALGFVMRESTVHGIRVDPFLNGSLTPAAKMLTLGCRSG